MSANQTIDGVPRATLANFIEYSVPVSGNDEAWLREKAELRALLDAPDTVSGKLPPVGRQAMWQAIDEALTGTVEPMLRGDICNILAALIVPVVQPQCATVPMVEVPRKTLEESVVSMLSAGLVAEATTLAMLASPCDIPDFTPGSGNSARRRMQAIEKGCPQPQAHPAPCGCKDGNE